MRFATIILGLFVFIMLVSGIDMGNCSDGTPYGQCSTVTPGKYCTGTVGNLRLEWYVEHCSCSLNPNYVEVNGTCVRKEGCAYGTISCDAGYECVSNTCVLKSGCDYDNPPCNTDNETCVNNTCVLKSGCDYDNPPCGANEACVNNECVLKQEGCTYDNPPCDFGYKCVNNVCVLKDSTPPPSDSGDYIPLPDGANETGGDGIMERIQRTCCCSTALLIFFVIGTGLVSVRG